MVSTRSTLMAAAFAFIACVDAHMMIATPTPYGKSSLNNSPLDPSGSDFPCKLRSGAFDAEGASNPMPLGSSQSLSFVGSAVHGGGSCQLSITYDNPPTKDSTFKVIHSIEGGCPAATAGNLPADPNGSGAAKFQYKIPDGLPTGNATLAWTWFNRIGNREMYMNCAPISLSGGSAKRDVIAERATNSFYDGLPDMFTANIGGACTTQAQDNKNLLFPNPGQSVEKTSDPAAGEFAASACGGGSGGSSGGSAPAAGGDAPASSAPAPVPSNTGGVFVVPSPAASVAPSAPAAAAPSAPASSAPAPVAPEPAAPAPPASAPAPSGGDSASTCDAASLGKTLCNGTGQIGTCDQGGKIVWMQVAAGTVCSDGYQVAARDVVPRGGRFSHTHLRRRHNMFATAI